MNIRSKNLKIRNLPKGNQRLDQINSKPYLFLGLFLVMGTALLLCKSYLLGSMFIILFFYNFCFVKNDILIEFYNEYAVFYHYNNHKDECFLLFWQDIAKWQYVHTKKDYDEIEVWLKNGRQVCIKCISQHKTLKYFKRYAGVDANHEVVSTHH